MKPLVSVIIPNYNYASYVREAIDSVLAQTYSNIEIIVVDDGSKDESKIILESYGNKIKAIFQQNQGVSAARNNGIEQSKGEFIAFLDADDVWLPQKIEKQIERFSGDESLGLVHVGVEDIDADGNILQAHLDGLEGDVSHELLLFTRAVILGGGSGIMIRHSILKEIGGFDSRLSTSADWDVIYQVSNRYKVGFIAEILLKYRIHGSNMHGNIPRMEREMMLCFEKAFDGKPKVDKRKCYGNLHKILAGSYFHAKYYPQFLNHTLKSLLKNPSNLGYFVEFPIRRLKKWK